MAKTFPVPTIASFVNILYVCCLKCPPGNKRESTHVTSSKQSLESTKYFLRKNYLAQSAIKHNHWIAYSHHYKHAYSRSGLFSTIWSKPADHKIEVTQSKQNTQFKMSPSFMTCNLRAELIA